MDSYYLQYATYWIRVATPRSDIIIELVFLKALINTVINGLCYVVNSMPCADY